MIEYHIESGEKNHEPTVNIRRKVSKEPDGSEKSPPKD